MPWRETKDGEEVCFSFQYLRPETNQMTVENAAALHQMMEVLLPTRRVIGFWSNVARSLRKKI